MLDLSIVSVKARRACIPQRVYPRSVLLLEKIRGLKSFPDACLADYLNV